MTKQNLIKAAVGGAFFCLIAGHLHAEEPAAEAVAEQPQAAAETPQAVEEAAEAENKFNVFEFKITGNSVLATELIEEAVYPWLGENKTVADVDKAREALEKTYHKAGYLTVLVDIPEQDVNQGLVTLNVTEGKVDKLRVKGSHYYSLGRIKAQLPALTEGGVPYFPDVQKQMGYVNRTADKRVTPVLKAGQKFGTVDVDLKVEDSLPVHASIELNNKYSNLTERWRLQGMLRYDNLFQRDHSLTLQYQTSPQDTSQIQVFSASYLYRFDDTDTMLSFYAVKSKSSVATIGGIGVLGNGTIFGARVIKPLPSLSNLYHNLSFGLDYKDFKQDIKFGSDTSSTPISYVPLAAQYSATYQDASSVNQLGLGLNFGMRGLVGDDIEFERKRSGAKSNFFAFKPELQRTQTLPAGMQLWAKLDGQFSGSPLISNEQFSAGGVDSVRGYLEVETLGDRGVHSTLELRSPVFRSGDWLQELRLIGFYDVAQVRIINPTLQELGQRVIAGSGVGVKARVFNNWNATMYLAKALHEGDVTKDGDLTGHMRFWYEF